MFNCVLRRMWVIADQHVLQVLLWSALSQRQVWARETHNSECVQTLANKRFFWFWWRNLRNHFVSGPNFTHLLRLNMEN